jgi:alpha-1,6-mannosyltransferase
VTPEKTALHWASARAWQTNTALSLLGFALLCLTRQLIQEFHHFTIGFSGVGGWSVIVYLAAVFLILTQPVNRYTFAIILTVGIACRLVTLLPEPHMSSDIYRYAWDGVVQHAHISPYRYVPGDPALTALRAPNQDLFDHINRRDYAHTIYPPVAEFLFILITFLNPTVTFMKLSMILIEGLTIYALLHLLTGMGFARERVLLYAWCPLLIWEIGSSGHLDSAAMAFIALALLARYRGKPLAAGAFLGTAIFIKFYPLVLLPALFRRGEYKMPAIIAALGAFSYACYASVGTKVFGFLGGYLEEEGIRSGTRYFLLEMVQHIRGMHAVPVAAYLVFVAFAFTAIVIWCWKTSSSLAPGEIRGSLWTEALNLPAAANFLPPAMVLAFTLMLLFSPHYPWYVAWLVPFFVLIPNLPLLAYTCGLFYLCTTPLGAGTAESEFLLNDILYAGVLLALVIDVVWRGWRMRQVVTPRTIPS